MRCPFAFSIIGAAVALMTVSSVVAKDFRVHVTGRLFCNGIPLKYQKVEMWEEDNLFDADDHLGETMTDRNGYFTIRGSQDEGENRLQPYIYIVHNCSVLNDGSVYKTWFEVPEYKLNDIYEMEDINLERA